MRQGVARDVLDVPAAGPDHSTIRQDDLQPENAVPGLAVLDAAESPGVRPEVAPDRADLVAGRILGVEQPLRRDRGLELRVEDPRLRDDDEIRAVDLEDPVHLRQCDREAAFDPGGAARETGSGTARDD